MGHRFTGRRQRAGAAVDPSPPDDVHGSPGDWEVRSGSDDELGEYGVLRSQVNAVFPVSQFARVHQLSPMEEELITLILSRVHLKEAAFRMGCSYSTVRTHAQRLSNKFGCSGLLQFLAWMIIETAKAGRVQSGEGSDSSSPAADLTTTEQTSGNPG